jgi:ketosteroid isomerase-like protein
MTNEEFVRQAYDLAEAKDIQGWIDCFTPDGVFVDTSVEVTYTGPTEVSVARLRIEHKEALPDD